MRIILTLVGVHNCQSLYATDDILTPHILRVHDTLDLSQDYSPTPSTGFIIPQCHSLVYNITLMKGEEESFPVKETGSSVGDVVLGHVGPGDKPNDLYVLNNSSNDITVYCAYEKYTQSGMILYNFHCISYSLSIHCEPKDYL